jgi:catechol 2,3-dioxygenase-like lactoylglutathione lyase family enzyme
MVRWKQNSSQSEAWGGGPCAAWWRGSVSIGTDTPPPSLRAGPPPQTSLGRIFAVALSLFATPALAQDKPAVPNASPGVEKPAEKLPTDIRRVTMIVRNMENSLKLYRDVMGMKVNYDAVLPMSGVALPAGKPGAKARLVLLNGNDPFIGWIGLMEWLDPRLPNPGPYKKRMGIGGHVIITQTDDVERRCLEALKVPGVAGTSALRAQQYPGRNGAPPINVRGCNFFDPDGTLIEMNQLIQ